MTLKIPEIQTNEIQTDDSETSDGEEEYIPRKINIKPSKQRKMQQSEHLEQITTLVNYIPKTQPEHIKN